MGVFCIYVLTWNVCALYIVYNIIYIRHCILYISIYHNNTYSAQNGGVLCCSSGIEYYYYFFSYCKNRHTGSNNTRRIQLTSFKLVGRSGWTWKGTFYRKNLRNILLMWPLIFSSVRFSPACVFILLLLLLRFFFLSFSSRLRTHTLIYIYIYASRTLSVYLFFAAAYTFYPRPQNWNTYYIIYTHTHTRRARTLYIISSPTDRQIVQFSSPPHYIIIYTPFWNVAGITCTRTLYKSILRVLTILHAVVAAVQYNVPIYINICIIGLEWTNIILYSDDTLYYVSITLYWKKFEKNLRRREFISYAKKK